MNLNNVELSGNLTRDAEVRATQSGTEVLTFSVAVNDRRKDPSNGEWRDYPNFVDCTYFNAPAWLVARLVKGAHVAVAGSLRQSTWTDKQTGKQRSKLEVIVRGLDLMSQSQASDTADQDVYASDIPF